MLPIVQIHSLLKSPYSCKEKNKNKEKKNLKYTYTEALQSIGFTWKLLETCNTFWPKFIFFAYFIFFL